jgi:hypothetical protein
MFKKNVATATWHDMCSGHEPHHFFQLEPGLHENSKQITKEKENISLKRKY